jgi:hypothetical protein
MQTIEVFAEFRELRESAFMYFFFLSIFLMLLRIRDSGIFASPRRATEVTTPSSTYWGSALVEQVRSAVFAPWLIVLRISQHGA